MQLVELSFELGFGFYWVCVCVCVCVCLFSFFPMHTTMHMALFRSLLVGAVPQKNDEVVLTGLWVLFSLLLQVDKI